jgi:hypothetical protein
MGMEFPRAVADKRSDRSMNFLSASGCHEAQT